MFDFLKKAFKGFSDTLAKQSLAGPSGTRSAREIGKPAEKPKEEPAAVIKPVELALKKAQEPPFETPRELQKLEQKKKKKRSCKDWLLLSQNPN